LATRGYVKAVPSYYINTVPRQTDLILLCE